MTLPVIGLDQEQVERVAGLLGEARAIKGQLEALKSQKKEKEDEIDHLLQAAALEANEDYRVWQEREDQDCESRYPTNTFRFILTLSEDGRSVVILRERRSG